MFKNITIFNTIWNDVAQPWQMGLQDSAAPGFTGIVELHNTLFFYLIVICIGVFWIFKYLNQDTLIKLIWVIAPALILIILKFFNFNYITIKFNLNILGFNLSLLTIFKFIILFLFLILLIYFLFIDDSIINKENKFIHSGINKNIIQIFQASAAGITLTSSYISIKNEFWSRDRAKWEAIDQILISTVKDITKQMSILVEDSKHKEKEKELAKYKNLVDSTKNFIDESASKLNRISEITTQLTKIEDTEVNKTKKDSLIAERELLIEWMQTKFKTINKYSQIKEADSNLANKEEQIKNEDIKDKEKTGIDKSKWINSPLEDNNIRSISFQVFQNISFSMLILNSVILSCIISIIVTFFGEHLINKFNLKSKYPKLARLIELRLKFQDYYIKFNVILLLLCLLGQMLFYLLILTI